MIRNALAIAWKDLQVLFRDRAQLAVLFVMPFMFGLLFGGIGGGAAEFKVYLVNDDPGQYGTQVVNTLNQVEVLSIEELDTVQEADQKIADGEAATAIIIPADFSQDVDAFDPVNDPARVQVIVDPAQQQEGGIVTGIVNDIMTWVNMQGEIQHGIRTIMDESGVFDALDDRARRGLEAQSLGAIMTQLLKASTDPLISVKSEDLEGVETQLPNNRFGVYATGYTVMFAFFIVGTISITLLTEKEQGTFRRLLASPLHRGSIILGKMLAYTLVVGLQVLVMFGVGRAFFDMPLGDSPLGLVLLTLALALAATSLGMLVATVAQSRGQAITISTLLSVVLAVVGGVMAGVPTKGNPMYWPSRLTPHAHAITAYFKLMVGGGVADILPQMGLLLGVAALFFVIAIWRFRFE
jgi:ABC-2 type transport system permease protein